MNITHVLLNDGELAKISRERRSADYVILDGSGGATGAAPGIFKNNISVPAMEVLARACGHSSLRDFDSGDLSTWKREVSSLTGIRYAGVSAPGGESS